MYNPFSDKYTFFAFTDFNKLGFAFDFKIVVPGNFAGVAEASQRFFVVKAMFGAVKVFLAFKAFMNHN